MHLGSTDAPRQKCGRAFAGEAVERQVLAGAVLGIPVRRISFTVNFHQAGMHQGETYLKKEALAGSYVFAGQRRHTDALVDEAYEPGRHALQTLETFRKKPAWSHLGSAWFI